MVRIYSKVPLVIIFSPVIVIFRDNLNMIVLWDIFFFLFVSLFIIVSLNSLGLIILISSIDVLICMLEHLSLWCSERVK